ncbi:hypothetical protein C8E03_1054 [Lachnotalea glycerini]|uniref:Uncharacterized protein n=1 Tax=Lachnotalea glycerini TaxID=1763509 RepID=A0A318ELG7_9FIRM|nr:hypothetical protein C8E03_1054 [Lachnotalea glycerini]
MKITKIDVYYVLKKADKISISGDNISWSM